MGLKARFTLLLSLAFVTLIAAFSVLVYVEVRAKLFANAKASLVTHLEHDMQHLDQPIKRLHPGSAGHTGHIFLRIWKSGQLVEDLFPQALPEERLEHRVNRMTPSGAYELEGFIDLTSTHVYLSALRTVLSAGGLLLLCLVLPLGYSVAGLLLEPFRKLGTVASTLTAKNLSFRFERPKHRDEYAKLVDNFNLLLHRLEKSFDQVTRFATNASHEIRTPLAVIVGQVEVALRRRRTSEEYEAVLTKVLRHGRLLGNIVNRLLILSDLERLEQGKKKEAIVVSRVLHEVVSNLGHRNVLAGAKEIAIEPPPGEVTFRGSPEVFHSVITNLVENAVKYSNSRISVAFRQSEGGVCVQVDDDGPGIAESERERVFEPFYKGAAARGGDKESHGLGLPIVKACVLAARGAIELRRSRKLGGLSVLVTFPDGSDAAPKIPEPNVTFA